MQPSQTLEKIEPRHVNRLIAVVVDTTRLDSQVADQWIMSSSGVGTGLRQHATVSVQWPTSPVDRTRWQCKLRLS